MGIEKLCAAKLSPSRTLFELGGRQRQDARAGMVKMDCVRINRAWLAAVGVQLRRGVRRHWESTNAGNLTLEL